MKIMLFTDIPPCKNYTAGIVLDILCGFLLDAGHQLCCFVVKNPGVDARIPSDKLDRMDFVIVDKPREDWGNTSSDPEVSRQGNSHVTHFELPPIAERAANFAKAQGVELIWSVIQGQVMIQLAQPVSKLSGIPYVFQTWDPPEWWLSANKVDPETSCITMEAFANAIRDSECFIAASWAMGEAYQQRYGCKKSIPVILGFTPEKVVPAGMKKKDDFVIALSGQIYATAEYEALVEGLNRLRWSYQGKKIVLRLYGRYFHLHFQKGTNIEVRGWMEQDELLPELADTDLLYCPYWFSEDFREASSLSFPSKLSTYLKTGVPVLMHGPEYASPRRFLERYDAGYICTTLDPDGIAEQIRTIMDAGDRDLVAQRGYQAFLDNLTLDIMRRNFFEALGLVSAAPEFHVLFSRKRLSSVVHVNNIDLLGNRFNGYDMMQVINRLPGISCRQFVMEKESENNNVISLCDRPADVWLRNRIRLSEKTLSLRGVLYPFLYKMMDHSAFQDADIVHYHLMHNDMGALPIWTEITAKKPSVLTVHDAWLLSGHCIYSMGCDKWLTGCGGCEKLDINFSMENDNTALMWKLKKLTMEKADLDIVVASDYMLDLVKRSPITRHFKHIHKIPFGINTDLFSPVDNKENLQKMFGVKKDHFVISFREDTSPYKGLECIKKALRRLKPQKPITLLTVGNKNLLAEFKSQYQIIEYGWLKDDSLMAQIYKASDLFLMPSEAEAFGMMAIEAMASGIPIVVCDGTSLPGVAFAPECGISIPQGDSDALCRNIERLIASPQECEERGMLGRKLALEYYRFEDYVERHLNLYEEILERKSMKQ
ncbi:glycosyltransferase [Desulfitobacterium dehalogenans ATCC 51507]|uniref:Glycosyltransferase n=1 Tax=Desulfitobacterium dehalogenans (strain ATCC 51507 / DSM 9161 / JW/IU-DC1) TaxID=756499 RepID=I4ADS1_DESDJ|nr:glycosyltransferase [Desulfitobacterium dehalogenans]AFM02106.1 glycosyltransferase [Desulfitobacterium dehalogenans ATCC 51507]